MKKQIISTALALMVLGATVQPMYAKIKLSQTASK